MNGPIEDAYFNWLCAQVDTVNVPTPSLTHWKLLRILHSTEFVWLLSGDDNRAEDGLELRREFTRYFALKPEESWQYLGCSVLEMLIAFSRRAEFDTDVKARDWFWIFIINLGLGGLNDAATGIEETVNPAIERLIWRRYRSDGSGGLFPIVNKTRDQTKLEIWYQFCDYLVDQDTFL
jgi:hypothetical protein